jgi:hypothetical protein
VTVPAEDLRPSIPCPSVLLAHSRVETDSSLSMPLLNACIRPQRYDLHHSCTRSGDNFGGWLLVGTRVLGCDVPGCGSPERMSSVPLVIIPTPLAQPWPIMTPVPHHTWNRRLQHLAYHLHSFPSIGLLSRSTTMVNTQHHKGHREHIAATVPRSYVVNGRKHNRCS